MENISTGKFSIFGLDIDITDYELLLERIRNTIKGKRRISIAYANASTINNVIDDPSLKEIFNSFDIIHPDGIGIYLASRLLLSKDERVKRMTGSDFYPILISEGAREKWGFFFFGHDNKTLEKISTNLPNLHIAGYCEGYNFDSESVINQINNSDANILVAGLGFPKQEKWISENKDRLKCNVIIAVGEGIKVFSGTKTRGTRLMQKMGFEWLARLVSNPRKYWKRYLIGIPHFLYRIIKLKLSKL